MIMVVVVISERANLYVHTVGVSTGETQTRCLPGGAVVHPQCHAK